MTYVEIIYDLPELTINDIKDCLA
ncbi:MAG: hypothetical protein OEX22_09405 [Cyclobacteriaceae bacterium]|nr:hypothetical protein [Cyclobacteriaceae bacterium]